MEVDHRSRGRAMPGHGLSLMEAGSSLDSQADGSVPQGVSSKPLVIQPYALQGLLDQPGDAPGRERLAIVPWGQGAEERSLILSFAHDLGPGLEPCLDGLEGWREQEDKLISLISAFALNVEERLASLTPDVLDPGPGDFYIPEASPGHQIEDGIVPHALQAAPVDSCQGLLELLLCQSVLGIALGPLEALDVPGNVGIELLSLQPGIELPDCC